MNYEKMENLLSSIRQELNDFNEEFNKIFKEEEQKEVEEPKRDTPCYVWNTDKRPVHPRLAYYNHKETKDGEVEYFFLTDYHERPFKYWEPIIKEQKKLGWCLAADINGQVHLFTCHSSKIEKSSSIGVWDTAYGDSYSIECNVSHEYLAEGLTWGDDPIDI